MTQFFYPRDYERNYDFLDRKIVKHLTDLLVQMDIFDTISVTHTSVIGIFYCRNKHHDQVEFNAKMRYDNNDPYLVQFMWYKNNKKGTN